MAAGTPSRDPMACTPTAPPPRADSPPPRVLVAEDNLTNRMVLIAMLRKLGIEPVVVDDGRKAVNQILAGGDFDLVLMDCEMPEMDGYTATRTIRDWERREQRPRLPIVAVTAHALAEHRQLCFEAGMDDHVAKPINLGTLNDVLRCWCPRLLTASRTTGGAVSAG